MITYLKVRNLAIVEEFSIELGEGLNVLTGETGAGKSLLIDSLEFLSGARGSTDSIRAGEERLTAETVIHVSAGAAAPLAEVGVDFEPGETGEVELVVRRELASNGRGRAFINGTLVPIRDLQSSMDQFVEIHGQNQSILRIAGRSFLEMLDRWAENESSLSEVATAHDAWKRASAELDELSRAERDREARLDLLRYQIDEISAARLDPREDEMLRSERAILANAEALAEATSEAFARLSDDEDSAIAQVGRASQRIETLTARVTDLATIFGELQDLRFRLQEVARSVADLGDEIRFDPDRLAEIEERLVTIDRLRRKYGGAVEAALAYLAEITKERNLLEDYEANLEKARKVEEARFREYRSSAESLSTRRREAAPSFENAIREELRELAMEKTSARVAISIDSERGSRLEIGGTTVAFGPSGYDRVEILIAPNLGEELKPLQKIASGGELSRIHLAIAASLFRSSEDREGATLVFDEIDAGIGGRVAEVIGRKLREIAKSNQVVCVTHLPQIACLGTSQFHVWKEEHNGRTRARIRPLKSQEERVEEIARMLAGETIGESARAHARELLTGASANVNWQGRKRPVI